MRTRRLAMAVTIAMAVGSFDLAGQGVPTVAVMDFGSFMMGDRGTSVHLGKAISAMVVTELSGRQGMRVVERSELNEFLRELKLNLSGRIEESDAIEVGRRLGARYVLHGQVTSIVDNLRMNIRAVDIETSEIVSVMKKSDKTIALCSVVMDLADEFAAALRLTPPPVRPDVELMPVTATIEFSRAVDFEDRGEVDQAVRHYEATLEIHPSHRGARHALERLRERTR